MKKMTKGIASMFLVLMLIKDPVLAAPAVNQAQSQQNNLKEDKISNDNNQNDIDNMEQDIEKLDEQIGSVKDKVDANKKLIGETEKNKAAAEKAVKDSEAEFEKSKNLSNNRLRALYINGMGGYLELLLGANSISDFISRIDEVAQLITYDKKTIDEVSVKKDDAIKKKNDLQALEDKLTAINKDEENKILSLNADKEKQKSLVEKAKKQQIILASNNGASVRQVNAVLQHVSDIRNNAPKIAISRGAASFSTNNVIAYATNFLGTPYLWGGTSPASGFDCSGFTQYVFRHFGIFLGRTTYDQIKEGTAVSRDDLQPGDLVFFGTWSNPHHMGIYIGNNTYIHAPHTGDVVKISVMTRTDFVTARRVR